ncbi:Zn(2)-C6 fungal-type DNA-binding domain protein [Ophiocordyceps camponoti-floridani]|uniref:Zn(2)-C6 fungal-type DNA-binding domain protein n=1 Tax=Ophiocordyceps camponoti-floridani TaxID=2030778 RepID=A0A8H4VDL1_9HYPO|nr:Zn(2)-C6 fungal-type DNA-binding domain protein [Ophiocordyceps camponoti-floridani]
MADFLASFNLSGDDGARPPSACASIDELQVRLQDLLAHKSTPTRAEHVAANVEIGANAMLNIGLTAAENGVLEGLNNLDPSLGGLDSSSLETDGEQMMRSVRAIDTLKNQPSEDPVLQRAVANLIVSTVSNTEGSSWALNDMSLGDRGWNFVYLCMDSSRQWDLVNKDQVKSIIGEYTLRDPDPTLMSRPAYDCRGSVRVSFPRDSRSILIKYDHTPFHRTVAEVAEFCKPPPRQMVAPKAKTPKKTGSARKKRDSTKANGESSSTPRKRKKTASQPQDADATAMTNEQQPLAELGQNSQPSIETAEGGFVDGLAPDATVTEGQAHSQAPASQAIPLNLSPEEAARRRDVATKLLSDAGVDPDTLSTEQFNIFANQSPELQKESLNMLVKYGAERLRIVHPSNRDSSASVPPSAAAPTAQAATISAPSTEPLGDTGAATSTPATKTGSGKKFRTPGKSRKACNQCKGRKVKCPRERPTCAECQTQGMTCVYAPTKPRPKKPKSDEFAPPEYNVDDESQMQQADATQMTLETEGDSTMLETRDEGSHGGGDAGPEEDLDEDGPGEEELQEAEDEEEEEEAKGASSPEETQQDETQQDETSFSAYPQVPVSDMLAPSVDVAPQQQQQQQQQQATPTPYFRSASGLALPQPEPQPMPAAEDDMMMTSQYQAPPTTHQSLTSDDAMQQLLESPTQPSNKPVMSRRSLPTAPARHEAVDGWSGVANSNIPRHSDSHTSSAQMQDAMALSQAALEHQRQTHNMPTAMQPSHRSTLSHPANDSRMKSRLGHRPPTMHDGYPSSSSMGNSRYRSTSGLQHSYNSFGGYADDQGENKIGYEPYTFQRNGQTGSSFSGYDYSRGQPPSTTTVENPGSNTMTSSYQPSSNDHHNSGSNLGLSDASSNNMSTTRAQHNVPSRTTSPYDPPGPSSHNHIPYPHRQPSSNHAQPQMQPQHQGQGGWYGSIHNSRPHGRSSHNHGAKPPTPNNNNSSANHGTSSSNAAYPFGLQRSNYNFRMPDESWGGGVP